MTYLTQRSSSYYFRLRIPSDLKSIIGTRELKRRLPKCPQSICILNPGSGSKRINTCLPEL
ncbi:MAG: hypothetical protein DRH26_10865 [Deltaproteobacteria bacterium]|nr:MAG: hypothetical protein DRH26_10865 [Deltaproteobacteria bacterium]